MNFAEFINFSTTMHAQTVQSYSLALSIKIIFFMKKGTKSYDNSYKTTTKNVPT